MIVYLPGAMQDLCGISRWYRSKRPEAEARLFERLRATVERIARNPLGFLIAAEDVDARRARVFRSPYSVVYVLRSNEVWIVAVFHGARWPGRWAGPR
jgi:plasmid stabilization system protein ParE